MKQSPLQLWIAIWQGQLVRAPVILATVQALSPLPWETPVV